MKFLSKNIIKLGRELSVLDNFVLDFVHILKKNTKYVIVSGYVSILFGRSRATEDVDFLVQPLSKEKLKELFNNLEKNGFYCINTSNPEKAFDMLKEHAIRFAREGQAIPNIEFKFAKRKIDKEVLNKPLTVKVNSSNLKIAPLEIQIAFKRYILKSEKDKEDAEHLELVFKEYIDKEKLKKYSKIFKKTYKDYF